MKMFKDGKCCNVDREQREVMKNNGWSTTEEKVVEAPEETEAEKVEREKAEKKAAMKADKEAKKK